MRKKRKKVSFLKRFFLRKRSTYSKSGLRFLFSYRERFCIFRIPSKTRLRRHLFLFVVFLFSKCNGVIWGIVKRTANICKSCGVACHKHCFATAPLNCGQVTTRRLKTNKQSVDEFLARVIITCLNPFSKKKNCVLFSKNQNHA